jgi:metal-responsive CopG/Arc/MetJ family transcriptional regulator
VKTRIGVSIDNDLLIAFRRVCNDEGLELSTVINELIMFFVDNREKISDQVMLLVDNKEKINAESD